MSKMIDLTGHTYGRLTVLRKDNERITNSGSYWICQCECGKIKSVRSSSLRRGEIQSCGCQRIENSRLTKERISKENMIGKKFGKLTVLERSPKKSKNGQLYWICECDCGNIIEVQGHSLRRKDGNQTVSCGCHHRSIGATNILNILQHNAVNFIEEYVFLDLPKSRFDFAIINNGQVERLIEFDGEQHCKDSRSNWHTEDLVKRDKEKNAYALSRDIPLVRIPHYKTTITEKDIFGDKFLIEEE